jgi:hypothetical protein
MLSRKNAGWFVVVAGVGALLLLPWWRNHALLRDFYDYGNIIAGIGRMQLGERAYVDFLTPIQLLQFWVGWAAEAVWGAEYLSLTYAAAVFMVAMWGGLAWLLARPLGGGLALGVSAAIVVASAGQHTIVWYNAMGVAWLAVAMWAGARGARGEGAGRMGWVLVAGALWLGGMTKLTYQVAALAFAGLWAWREERGVRRVVAVGAILAAGVVAPIATEMAVTGASLAEWKKNVLGLAASRLELLEPIATWRFYWQTPHDYHQPMYFAFAGAWGVALLLVVGGAAVWRARRERVGVREWVFLAVAWGGAMSCGLVFLALHFEIAYVAGAAWLVLATGLVLTFVPRELEGPWRLAGGALAVGAVSLFVPAWVSAWAGARAIWSQQPLVRSELVTTKDLPERFSYLRGIRILPEWKTTLRRWERVREELAREGIGEDAWYFVNGTEWLVRAMPEARHRGLPLWLQEGTTYGEAERPEIVRRIERGDEVKVVVSHHPWAMWPKDIEAVLERRFRRMEAGPAFVTWRVWSELDLPLQFVERFDSNLYSRDLDARGGALEMQGAAEAPFFGARESARLVLKRGVYRLRGEFRAELSAGETRETAVRFRVRKLEGADAGALLWEESVALGVDARDAARPFAVSPGGQRVALEVEVPEGSAAAAGWRSLQVEHAGEETAEEPPRGVTSGLAERRITEAERGALWGAGELAEREVVVRGEARGEATGLVAGSPSELWVRLRETDTRVSGAFRISADAASARVRVVVAHYKSGRFERMEVHDGGAGEERRFEVPLRERTGWLVLVVVPRGEDGAAVRWSEVRVR